ncbi:MAG: MFS transporter [Rhodobiaceae bacterium]|nr:MFS transporter [Rhodobiaceae bacterium]
MREQQGIFFGWWVLIAIGYSLFVGAGMIFYAMSVLLEALVATRGFSVAQISGANTMFLVVGGLGGIAVGELISRYDARWCIAAGTLFIAVTYYWLPAAHSLGAIYLAYAALGVGYAMTALVPATTLVARWFVRRRALAIALTQSGLSLGGILLTPLLARALEIDGMGGLREPWVLVVILFNVPLALLLLRPDPQAMGLSPDGDNDDLLGENAPQQGMAAVQAIRSRFFLFSAAAAFLALLAQVGTIAHVFKWALERANGETAAITVATLAFCSLTGRLICGAVLDRLNLFVFVMVIYALQAVAMFGMALVEGTLAVLMLTAFFGFTVGNVLMAQPLLVAAAFGVRDFPRILSLHQLAMNGGVALGPVVIGLIYDFGGGYANGFAFVSLCSIAALGCIYRAGDPKAISSAR